MKTISLKLRVLCVVAIAACALVGQAEPAGRVGRAVIAALTPNATATYPDKTVHDYPQGHLDLREGLALSELHTINTDPHGRMCMVLTPGAMLCVRPSTSVKLDRLEQMTDGLPETGKDLQRRIELTVTQGAVLLHAGPPTSNMTIRLAIPVGTVTANGGEFLVMQDKGDWVIGSYRDGVSVTTPDGTQPVAEGKLLRLTRDASGRVSFKFEEGGVEPYRNRFDMCLEFFPELGKLVFLPTGVDLGGLQSWLGTPGGIVMVGDPLMWSDVTPSVRYDQVPLSVRTPPAAGRGDAGGQWTRDQIWAWYRNAGVIRGVYYIPRVAVNAIEFWQAQRV